MDEDKEDGLFITSNIQEVGNITIQCISKEAKDLIDKIMGAWSEHYTETKKILPNYNPTFYGFTC